MRAFVVALIMAGGGAVGLFYLRRLLQWRRRPQQKPMKAYFSGGPFDGQERDQEALPKVLTFEEHVYERTHQSGYDAIYEYAGLVSSSVSRELM